MKQLMEHIDKDYHQVFKDFVLHSSDEFRPHSQPYIVYGTLILWIAWLFFNGGS